MKTRQNFLKSLVLTAVALLAVILDTQAQNVGEAFYIYRNDGEINGFLRNEVDSISFSNYDADSVYYNDMVTQLVYTPDSLYCIPLAAIDSVSFVQPETVYKPGVINLSDKLMPYVIKCDSLTITFSSSTPFELFPKVGDKLVTLEMNEMFPAGFAGEVINVRDYQVECRLVSLEKIFETLYSVTSVYGYQGQNEAHIGSAPQRIESYGNKSFTLNTFTWSKSAELSAKLFGSDKLALKGGAQLSVSITPSFHVMSTLIINREEGTYFNACITGDITLQKSLGIYGGLEWSNDFLDKEWVKAPVAPLIYFYMKPGLFIRASATASFSATMTERYATALSFGFSTKGKNVLKPTCNGRLVSSLFDVEGAVDGSFAAGGFLEFGLSVLNSDIDRLAFRGELGGELVGHAVLYNSDIEAASRETKVYERFKNSNIFFNAFVSTSVQADMGPFGYSESLPWNLNYNIRTWDVVPKFSNVKFKQKLYPQTSAEASANMSGNCLFPVVVGLSVREKNGSEANGYYDNTKFDRGNKSLSHTFNNLSTGADYTLYPKIRIWGYEILASPSSDMEDTEFPVEITNFEQISSKYEEDGFSHNGTKYSYRYDCAVTVSLKDNKNVEDWGYVYIDPNGQKTFISLTSFASPYTDKRYAYYRNSPQDVVSLCPYVKIRGEERIVGEMEDYQVMHHDDTSCPDANHPHMIDLGLPSGTKWACCNVGATTPEGYGNYYAWGETSPKSFYGYENYAFFNGYNGDNLNPFTTLGDIAGTQYDAATANWGAPWRMPSLAQIQELLNNCSDEWTAQNGVKGRKFTGPNGGTIFLPAAGYRWYGELGAAGAWGIYWSSSSASSYWNGAYRLYFDSECAFWHDDDNDRHYGPSVRPVLRN